VRALALHLLGERGRQDAGLHGAAEQGAGDVRLLAQVDDRHVAVRLQPEAAQRLEQRHRGAGAGRRRARGLAAQVFDAGDLRPSHDLEVSAVHQPGDEHDLRIARQVGAHTAPAGNRHRHAAGGERLVGRRGRHGR